MKSLILYFNSCVILFLFPVFVFSNSLNNPIPKVFDCYTKFINDNSYVKISILENDYLLLIKDNNIEPDFFIREYWLVISKCKHETLLCTQKIKLINGVWQIKNEKSVLFSFYLIENPFSYITNINLNEGIKFINIDFSENSILYTDCMFGIKCFSFCTGKSSSFTFNNRISFFMPRWINETHFIFLSAEKMNAFKDYNQYYDVFLYDIIKSQEVKINSAKRSLINIEPEFNGKQILLMDTAKTLEVFNLQQ